VHTVFGKVISGMEHVTAISEVDTPNSTPQNDGSGDTPINEVRLMHVTVND
jgi:cyclophilin family peptidyl-prolyl cis-trans isomerase